MTRYIDKDALVAKIDDWRHNIMMGVATTPLRGRQRADSAFEYEILGLVRDFLDTIEVKEVDLEKEIEFEYNPVDGLSFEEFARIAKHFYSLGLAQKGEK